MSLAVLSLTICFVSMVYGIYQSRHVIYKGQVPFSNRQSTIKDIFVPSHANDLIYCGLQCVREPKCLAIEMCTREDRQLCRLCNSTNPSFIENETDSCRHLQPDYQRDNTDTCLKASVLHTCKDLLSASNCGMVSSGVYSVNIDGKPTEVWCDMDTDGGGWTVIQRRQNGNTDFYRSWNKYRLGFGNVSDEYWIGNDALHILTTTRNVTLRIDLEQFNGTTGYGTWNTFRVDNETQHYRLSLSEVNGFNGNSKIYNCLHDDNDDSFNYNNGQQFSTKDRDNDALSDAKCAVDRQGGWWYKGCTAFNPNGRYYTSPTVTQTSVYCSQWAGNHRSLKRTKMMLR